MIQLTLPLLVPILTGGVSDTEPTGAPAPQPSDSTAFVEDLGSRLADLHRSRTQREDVLSAPGARRAGSASAPIRSMDEFVRAVSDYGHQHSHFVGELIHSIHLARIVDHEAGEAACETVWSDVGSVYDDGASWLITHPTGSFDLIDEDGQVTPTSEFTLMPVALTELPFHIYPDTLRAQLEPFADVFRDYALYSVTLPDGSQHSGMAAHFDDGAQLRITLYPDTVSGAQLVPPADLMLMRWFLWEDPAITATVLLDALIPDYVPPTWSPRSDADGAARAPRAAQGIEIPDDISDCMWEAIRRWEISINWTEHDYETHMRLAEEDYKADLQVFNECLEDYARQTGGLAMVSHTISSWVGLNIVRDDYQQYIDGFKEDNEAEYEQEKRNAKNNLKHRRKFFADRLIGELEDCLDGFAEAEAVLAPYVNWRNEVHDQNQ